MDYRSLVTYLTIILSKEFTTAQDDSSCTLPNKGQSKCVRLHNCEPLMTIIRKSGGKPSAADAAFIQGHACESNRFVCCPKDSIPNAVPDNTQIMNDRLNVIASHRNIKLINKNCGLGVISRVHLLGGGGTEALIGKYPWMALLKYKAAFDETHKFKCGGSLISSYYVLTAAHCISRNLIAVRLGEHRISTLRDCLDDDCSDPIQDIPIQAMIKHEQFKKSSRVNDIAILRLKNEAVFGSSVQTICLPTALNNQIDVIERSSRENLIMTGWGRTEIGKASDVLVEVKLPHVSNSVCNQTYGPHGIEIQEGHICAGGRNEADACEGDSGGPLQSYGLVEGSIRMIQYGVVATGFECEYLEENHPGIYTNVAFYLDWILDNMSDSDLFAD